MSNAATKRMIQAYMSQAEPTRFFTSMFRTPRENFYNTESVEIDIMRAGEDVAIAITDLSTGYNMNRADLYTNKEFVPPIFGEAVPLNSLQLLKREFGTNPFQQREFQAKATTLAMQSFRKIESKIRRSIELQASQVLQTGTVTLINSSGTAVFTVNYSPKATHFPTAGVSWGSAGATPLADLGSLANVIRDDGLLDPNQVIMGEDAYSEFIKDPVVQAALDNRRINIGAINPMVGGGTGGGNYRGAVDIGNYKFDIWTYGGRYKHPQTGVSTQYLDPSKVIMKSSESRLDGTYGNIPRFVAPDQRVLRYLPGRMQGTDVDLHSNAWLTKDGEQLFVGLKSRPLMIPTAIDTFGCLETGA